MYFCTACKLDFDAERLRPDVTVKCIKCGSGKCVISQHHPLKNIVKKYGKK